MQCPFVSWFCSPIQTIDQKVIKQAGAELGQAQLKLELGFTSTYLLQIDEQESHIVLCLLASCS